MRRVSLFVHGNSQVVRIPKDMAFTNTTELEIHREGETLILRPVRPDWLSYAEAVEKADDGLLTERPAVISDEGRFSSLRLTTDTAPTPKPEEIKNPQLNKPLNGFASFGGLTLDDVADMQKHSDDFKQEFETQPLKLPPKLPPK